jgi:hypothetical protein
MTDQVETYLDAKTRCEEKFATLKRIRATVSKVASALERNPREFSFENSSVGLPRTVPHSGVYVTDWYPAEDIQRALSDCHRAVMEVEAAWAPVSGRTGLQPPGTHGLRLCPAEANKTGRAASAREGDPAQRVADRFKELCAIVGAPTGATEALRPAGVAE